MPTIFPLSLVIFFDLWIVLALTVQYGFVSRWHGGGFFPFPKIIKNLMWGLPMGFISGWAYLNYRAPSVDLIYHLSIWFGPNFPLYRHALWAVPVAVFVLVTGFSAAAKSTGHGGAIDLGHSPLEPGNGRDPEQLEYLILWLNGRIPAFWYDFLLLTIIGIFSTLAPAIALGLIYAPAGVVLVIGGACKAIAYDMGWRMFPFGEQQPPGTGPCDFRECTQIGEWRTGLFAGFALSCAYITLKVWIYAHH